MSIHIATGDQLKMTSKKITVLLKIKEEKEVLFGTFSPIITKEKKAEKWKEVKALAESVGLIKPDKTWQYIRDNTWSNWRKRTMAKKDNASKTGSTGGKKRKLNELDHLVLDIVGRDNPVVTGKTPEPENFSENRTNTPFLHGDTNDQSTEDGSTMSEDSGAEKKVLERARNLAADSKRNSLMDFQEKKNKKIELQIENLELMNYKTKLEIISLERNLGISNSTQSCLLKDLLVQNT